MAACAASAIDFSLSALDDGCPTREMCPPNHEYVDMESSHDSDTYSGSLDSSSSFHGSSLSQSTGATSASSSASNVRKKSLAVQSSVLGTQTQRPNALDYCIDPRLTSIGSPAPNYQVISHSGNWSYKEQTVSGNATLPETHDPFPVPHLPDFSQHCPTNDFDTAFNDVPVTGQNPSASPWTWLYTWVATNPGRFPNPGELASLNTLSGLPETEIAKWLSQHLFLEPNLELEPVTADSAKNSRKSRTKRYRPKCRRSQRRFRYIAETRDETRVLECTHGCGQSFDVTGQWTRHERYNTEEWKCHECKFVSPRKDKLLKHLRQHHSFRGAIKKSHCHQLLQPDVRPCGFCLKQFNNWSEWLNHVAAHFLGRIAGGPWTMVRWNKAADESCGLGDSDDDNDDDDDDDDEDDEDNDQNHEDDDESSHGYDSSIAGNRSNSSTKGKGASYGSSSKVSSRSSGSSVSKSAGSHNHKPQTSMIDMSKTDISRLQSNTNQLPDPIIERPLETLAANVDDFNMSGTRRWFRKAPALARPLFRKEEYYTVDSVPRPSSARVRQQVGRPRDIIYDVGNRDIAGRESTRSVPKTEASRQGNLKEETSEKEELDTRYRPRKSDKNCFMRGRVFAMLWPESAGEIQTSKRASLGRSEMENNTLGRFGQHISSHIRRMVVVIERGGFCCCVPINTYGSRGVVKHGLSRQEREAHSVVYMSEAALRNRARQNIDRREGPITYGDQRGAQAVRQQGSYSLLNSDPGSAQELIAFGGIQEHNIALSYTWDTGIPFRLGNVWILQSLGPSSNENRNSIIRGAKGGGHSSIVQFLLDSKVFLENCGMRDCPSIQAAASTVHETICGALVNRDLTYSPKSYNNIDWIRNGWNPVNVGRAIGTIANPYVCHSIVPVKCEWVTDDVGRGKMDLTNNISDLNPWELKNSFTSAGQPFTQPTDFAGSSRTCPPNFDTIRMLHGGQDPADLRRFKIERFLNERDQECPWEAQLENSKESSGLGGNPEIFGDMGMAKSGEENTPETDGDSNDVDKPYLLAWNT